MLTIWCFSSCLYLSLDQISSHFVLQLSSFAWHHPLFAPWNFDISRFYWWWPTWFSNLFVWYSSKTNLSFFSSQWHLILKNSFRLVLVEVNEDEDEKEGAVLHGVSCQKFARFVFQEKKNDANEIFWQRSIYIYTNKTNEIQSNKSEIKSNGVAKGVQN